MTFKRFGVFLIVFSWVSFCTVSVQAASGFSPYDTPMDHELLIVIDDFGYELTPSIEAGFFELSSNIAFSIIPQTPRSRAVSQRCDEQGRDYLAHIPWEPINPELSPEPALIACSASDAILYSMVRELHYEFPSMLAANNHQGSLASQDHAFLSRFAEVWKATSLPFLDSRTVASSQVRSVFESAGIPVFSNQRFLDHVDDLDIIRENLQALSAKMQTQHRTIVIGHPRRNTLVALREWLNEGLPEGARLIALSDWIRFDTKAVEEVACASASILTISPRSVKPDELMSLTPHTPLALSREPEQTGLSVISEKIGGTSRTVTLQ
jgi:uncharacterized protein